jgi:hypothetical protein
LAEKGLVLGALLARMPPASFTARFPDLAGGRAAVEALAAEARSVRVAALAELMALVRAPVPAGVERIHPGWLHERLWPEPSAVIRAVAEGLPREVREVAERLLAERGEAAEAPACSAAGAAELRRRVFAGLVPLVGPGAPAGPEAAPLMARSLAAVEEALELRGSATLGASLRGAPGEVVARAAAGLGVRLAGTLVAAAAQPGPPEARAAARILVARAAAEKAADLAADLGARALAGALAPEGLGAVQAVAQRLRPALGRRLLRFADETAV